ncbi:MAG: 30S ribosomal protein S9 [Candidatus Parcubacteria bacterium]|nr:30S ribosomal protein S9 [Candidatus Parcubacteria bacterium]
MLELPAKKKNVGEKYIEAVGRRKTAIARVRLFPVKDKIEFLINNKDSKIYLPNPEFQRTMLSALEMMNCLDKFSVSAKASGGGRNAQAEAIRHGISRALIKFNPDFRKRLKKAGFLTRDSRMRERKKFGLKRARRGPQWSKR